MIMKFEDFEAGMRTLLRIKENSDKINELGKQISEDFIYVESYDTYDYIIGSLCWWSKEPEAREKLEEFIWELDFGRKWVKTTPGIKEIKFSTIKDIYDYLKGTPCEV